MRLVELWSMEQWKRLGDDLAAVTAKTLYGPVAVGDRFTVGCTADGEVLDIDAVVERAVIFVVKDVDSIPAPYSGRFTLRGLCDDAGRLWSIAGLVTDPGQPPVEALSAAGEADRYRLVIDRAQPVGDAQRVSGPSRGRLADGDRLLLLDGEGATVEVTGSELTGMYSAGVGDLTGFELVTDLDAEALVGRVLLGVRPADRAGP